MQQLTPQLEPAAAGPHVRSILIIDDDASIADVLAISLDRQGYHTETAPCGRDGYALAQVTQPDLVILDVRLPDIDGLTVCRMLADDPATCTIPVIILSGMERPDIIRRSRAAGCLYFVRKPYDPNALLVLVQQAIEPDDPLP